MPCFTWMSLVLTVVLNGSSETSGNALSEAGMVKN